MSSIFCLFVFAFVLPLLLWPAKVCAGRFSSWHRLQVQPCSRPQVRTYILYKYSICKYIITCPQFKIYFLLITFLPLKSFPFLWSKTCNSSLNILKFSLASARSGGKIKRQSGSQNSAKFSKNASSFAPKSLRFCPPFSQNFAPNFATFFSRFAPTLGEKLAFFGRNFGRVSTPILLTFCPSRVENLHSFCTRLRAKFASKEGENRRFCIESPEKRKMLKNITLSSML